MMNSYRELGTLHHRMGQFGTTYQRGSKPFRGRGRGASRGASARGKGASRGRGMPRGRAPHGRGASSGRGHRGRGTPRIRGAPRGRGAPHGRGGVNNQSQLKLGKGTGDIKSLPSENKGEDKPTNLDPGNQKTESDSSNTSVTPESVKTVKPNDVSEPVEVSRKTNDNIALKEDGPEEDSHEKQNTGEDTKPPVPPILCSVCNVYISSEVCMKEHIAGKRHKAALDAKKQNSNVGANRKQFERKSNSAKHPLNLSADRGPIRSTTFHEFGASKDLQRKATLPTASVQAILRSLCETEDVVGMQYVSEYRQGGTNRCTFLCNLCDSQHSIEQLPEHLVSRRHRLRYARIHLFSAYARITGYPSLEDMMAPAQLDKFLAYVCGRVVNADYARGMRSCRVRRFIDEADITVDLDMFAKIGKQHPSMYKDLLIVESTLQDDGFGGNSRSHSMSGASPSLKRPFGRSEGLGSFESVMRKYSGSDLVTSHKAPHKALEEGRLLYLEKKKHDILDSLEATPTSATSYSVTGAHKKERAGLLNQLDETNNEIRKIQGVAQSPLTDAFGRDDSETTGSKVAHLQIRRRERPVYRSLMDEIPEKRRRNDGQAAVSSESLAEIQKTVEPIINETRRRIERKIYEAMESGSLHSVLNALKSNPRLHDSLLEWEKDQSLPEDSELARRQNPMSDNPVRSQRASTLDKDTGLSRKHALLNEVPYSENEDRGFFRKRPLLEKDPVYSRKKAFLNEDSTYTHRQTSLHDDPGYSRKEAVIDKLYELSHRQPLLDESYESPRPESLLNENFRQSSRQRMLTESHESSRRKPLLNEGLNASRIKPLLNDLPAFPGPSGRKTLLSDIPGPPSRKTLLSDIPAVPSLAGRKTLLSEVPGPSSRKPLLHEVPGLSRRSLLNEVPGLSRRRTLLTEAPGLSAYVDGLYDRKETDFPSDNPYLTYKNSGRRSLAEADVLRSNARRLGLLGSRPALGENYASTSGLRRGGAGW